jgi:hypothetical protein
MVMTASELALPWAAESESVEAATADDHSEHRKLLFTAFSSTWPITRPVDLLGGLAVAPLSACC